MEDAQTLQEPNVTEPVLELEECVVFEKNFQVTIHACDGDSVSCRDLPYSLCCIMGNDEDMDLLQKSLVLGTVRGQLTKGAVVVVCDDDDGASECWDGKGGILVARMGSVQFSALIVWMKKGAHGLGWGHTDSLDAVLVRLCELIKEFVSAQVALSAQKVEFKDESRVQRYFLRRK